MLTNRIQVAEVDVPEPLLAVSRRHGRALGPMVGLVIVLASLFVSTQSAVADAAKVVTTKTGVKTHGAIKTTPSTIGWLLTCPLSHRLPDDPITAPGKPGAAHMHDFTGNASVNAYSTLASMEDPKNQAVADKFAGSQLRAGTSCNLSTYSPGTSGDTAAYWRPTLYADGQPITSTVKDQLYYRANTLEGTDFKPIPQDARLIVGSHDATSIETNEALVDGHLYWECSSSSSDQKYAVPPENCSSILQNVIFPSCWDGKPMDHSGEHGTDNNHFAYPEGASCPSGFPVKVPQLSEKFKYNNIPRGAKLELSADAGEDGLAPMYTAHADFWNTWNAVSLQYLTTNCINARISCGTNPITPVK